MAEPYLSQLQSICDRAGVPFKGHGEVSCRHFFSGAAAYADGHIFVTLTSAGLALKLPEDDRNALFAKGARPVQYFAKAPVKKDYALLPSQLVGDQGVLNHWISRSIDFVARQ